VPKGKTNLDLNEAKDDCVVGWQWHQLDHVHTICTLLQTDNHTNTSSLNFYRPDALSDAQPTVSKHWREQTLGKNCGMLTFPAESLQNLHSAHRVMQSGAVEPFRPRNLVSFGILAPKISYSALYWCCFMTKLRTVPPHAPAVFQCLWWIKKKSRVLLLSLFNSLFSRTTWVSLYQKGKTSLDGFKWGKRWWDFGMQWHQLDHMQTICTMLQTDNYTNVPSLNFYRSDALPDTQPIVSEHWSRCFITFISGWMLCYWLCVLKTQSIEDFLEQELMQCMPGFIMTEFLSELVYVELVFVVMLFIPGVYILL